MRRTDRLYALVEELRARAPRPISRSLLAERLEVTERTVERDISALQQAGVPIWSQRGRGGGYAIDAQWSLPPLNFDATEALAVIAALATAQALPFADAGKRAEQKVLAAMTDGEARRARELAGRLRLGTFGTPVTRDVLVAVEEAVVERRVVELAYRDRGGSSTSRPVEAHGLHLSGTGSYLVGWCRMRDAGRAFRLDRIVSIRLTDEVAPSRELDALLDWVDDAVVPDVVKGDVMPTKGAVPTRRWGPPRKAEDVTGTSPAFAVAVATALPGATSADRRGRIACAVSEATFLTVDDTHAVVGDDRFVLGRIGRDDLRGAIEDAWRAVAPKRAVTAWARRRAAWEALPPLTHDDVRRVVLSFPAANEGPIWGTDVGFRIGPEKKGRFARFGPPVGNHVGNLLAPDDVDTLVLFACEQKPELLASRADRWFTTAHYGPPDEPGGVITRLAEWRGEDDLGELAEVIEDAWRGVASPALLAELDGRDR
jgi:predicted DNA-binding transcriptional regulator YafY